MADQIQKGGFVPVTMEDLQQGPFSAALTPTQQAPLETPPHPGQGKAATVARLGTKFLQGASEGRLKAFQQNEAQRLSKLNRLNAYVQSIEADPNIAPEAKQLVRQQYFRVLGPMMATAGDEKGKGKGKGAEGEKQGLPHMIANAMKEIGLGMAGGKLPKHMPDVGGAYDAIQQAIFDEKTGKVKSQYDVQGIIASNQSQIEQALKTNPPKTQEEALGRISPMLQRVEALDPARARSMRADFLTQFPPMGSEAAMMREYGELGKSPTPPAVELGPSTGFGIVPGSTPQQPQTDKIPVGMITLAEMISSKGGPKIYEKMPLAWTDNNGKEHTILGAILTHPREGQIAIDLEGNRLPVPVSQIRKGSTAAPRVSRLQYRKDLLIGGKAHTGVYDSESGKIVRDDGLTPATSRGGRAARPVSPQTLIAQRKLKSLEALEKIMEQTKYDYDPKQGRSVPYAQYLRDNALSKFYMKDPAVVPYLPEVRKLLDDMIRTEKNTKQDIVSILMDQKKQASTEHRDSVTEDRNQHLQDTLNEIDADLSQIQQPDSSPEPEGSDGSYEELAQPTPP